jgi:hypothetical protein
LRTLNNKQKKREKETTTAADHHNPRIACIYGWIGCTNKDTSNEKIEPEIEVQIATSQDFAGCLRRTGTGIRIRRRRSEQSRKMLKIIAQHSTRSF